MISSLTNPKIKQVRRLQTERRSRQREQAFVAEGTRWLRSAEANRVVPTMSFCTEKWQTENQAKFRTKPLLVSDAVMNAMSDMESAPGVLLVLPLPDLPIPTDASLLLVLDQVRTPGNMGTILRSAVAAGVAGVILSAGCVDPFNAKAVRGGMGAQLVLPIHTTTGTDDWAEIAALLDGRQICVADDAAEATYTDIDWTQPSALIIGNEANGVSEQAEQIGHPIMIPMAQGIDSLNAAIAASVILYEAARQRRIANN